jgi:hypothetical protein
VQKDRLQVDCGMTPEKVFLDAALILIKGSNCDNIERDSKTSEELDYCRPVIDIFTSANAMLKRKIEDSIQLELVEAITSLDQQMGVMKLNKIRDSDKTQADWSLLASLSISEYVQSNTALQFGQTIAPDETDRRLLAERLSKAHDQLTQKMRRNLGLVFPSSWTVHLLFRTAEFMGN